MPLRSPGAKNDLLQSLLTADRQARQGWSIPERRGTLGILNRSFFHNSVHPLGKLCVGVGWG